MLVRLKLVCVASDKNIDIELPLNQRQSVDISPWYNLMPMTQTNSKLSYCDDFLLRIAEILLENEH